MTCVIYEKDGVIGAEFRDEDEEDSYSLAEKLGYLEWAKAVILESVKIENAIEEYNEEEI